MAQATRTTVIALLRGINVGGRNKLPMAQLREIAASMGLTDVQTYIQSGNLVASAAADGPQVAVDLAAAIESTTGLRVPVIVRTTSQWAELVAANPFPDVAEPGTHVHVICLPSPAGDALRSFDSSSFAPEEVVFADTEVYLHLPDGMGRSKLAIAVNRIPAAAAGTARNWNTVRKLAELAESGE